MMSKKMTDLEFAAKVEAEGALYAFTEYGLTEKDLEDDSQLRGLVSEVVRAGMRFGALIEELEEDLEEIMEEQDNE